MNDAGPAIIFVPGIRPKPIVADHQEQLRRCLVAGMLKAGAAPQVAAEVAGAFDVVGWSYEFYGHHGDQQPDMPGIERLLADQDDPENDLREATSFLRRFTGLVYGIFDHLPFLTELFATPRMETRLREIRRYFFDRMGAGTNVRQMVAAALKDAWANDRRVLLVGHSFGSVIAYDTLWELTHVDKHPGHVDMFVTMGSPLTLDFMRRHLKGAHERGARRYPSGIATWVNLAAVGEVTALDRKLGEYFQSMTRLGVVGSIEDDLDLINQFHGPDGLNVHKCYGYFASQKTGQLLLDWYESATPAKG